MSNQKALVVEDSPIPQKIVKLELIKMQYDVDTTNTGGEAIQLACDNKYDVILMDIGLDDMTGCDATEQIRQSGMNTSTLIIALTAHNDDDTRASCAAVGMDAFMAKPFTKEKFQEVLKNLGKSKKPQPGR